MSSEADIPPDNLNEEIEPVIDYKYLPMDTIAERTVQLRSIAVTSKYVIVGTDDGLLSIQTFDGKKIKQYQLVSAAITDISVSDDLHIAVAFDSGDVGVINPHKDGWTYHLSTQKPVYAVSIHPSFGTKREFIFGGEDQKLVHYAKQFLGSPTSILSQGDGVIYSIKWNGRYVAWANSLGVRVYDFDKKSIIARIGLFQPQQFAIPKTYPFNLSWYTQHDLLLACGNTVIVYRITDTPDERGRLATIVHQLNNLDFIVSGVAPFMQHIALLCTYEPEQSSSSSSSSIQSSTNPPSSSERPFPVLRLISPSLLPSGRATREQIAAAEYVSDELSFPGAAQLRPRQLGLAGNIGEVRVFVRGATGVIEACHVDADTHIRWLVARGRFEEALQDATGSAKNAMVQTSVPFIVGEWLTSVCQQKDWKKAAMLGWKYIQECPERFETLVWDLIAARRLSELGDIPTSNPQLTPATYNAVLSYFLPREPERFVKEMLRLPENLYDAKVLLMCIRDFDLLQQEIGQILSCLSFFNISLFPAPISFFCFFDSFIPFS